MWKLEKFLKCFSIKYQNFQFKVCCCSHENRDLRSIVVERTHKLPSNYAKPTTLRSTFASKALRKLLSFSKSCSSQPTKVSNLLIPLQPLGFYDAFIAAKTCAPRRLAIEAESDASWKEFYEPPTYFAHPRAINIFARLSQRSELLEYLHFTTLLRHRLRN